MNGDGSWRGGVVLVTGAGGFTGSRLVWRLWEEGVSVRALVRDRARAADLLPAGVSCVAGDLRSRSVVREAVSGVRTVFHVAALYRSVKAGEDELRAIHVDATEALYEAALEAGCDRIVHCSTAGVHGDVERIPADESSAFRPGDAYQRTKLGGEEVARRYIGRACEGAILRPTGIFGPGDGRFLKLFRGVWKRTFVRIGSGRVYYHLTYVDDVVSAFLACADRDGLGGEAFIVAGQEYVTVEDLIGRVAGVLGVGRPRVVVPLWAARVVADGIERGSRLLGVEPVLHRRRLDFFCKNRAFTSAKLQGATDWRPGISLDEGLARTARWYREQGAF